ncbi:MAG: sigma-54-dependent Fis family transcriptional regulator [Comamonadaceae bacterium SCN 68-20]|mgnify:CR=1 FL=1|nr:MAG: sigma-54-dependent Fis family transcriptional regulator [Comamonadaceae bacterium SCN 68-20]
MNSLLLLEDDPIMGESLVQRFELEGFEVCWCQRIGEAAEHLARGWGAVVSDVRLADGLATQWFVELPEAARRLPWFFITGYGSVNDAVAAIRAGAREYVTKPFDIEHLVALVQQASSSAPTRAEEGVLGISPAMRHAEALVRKVARQRVPVLLTGESGVGKEVAAQLIHQLGDRCATGEFVAVNCAAVPETMMEAEFFGYERNAFTGAARMHRGYLERAHGGTLFLDEVGELPASMQAKLLRALQEHSFFRLGSEKVTRSDFRVIAATNRDLHADMAAGTFREDLYYRLAVIRIGLPPLRERPEDIRWLTERMLQELAAEQGRPVAMSEAFLRDVLGRSWKGNARELRSFLEEAVVLSEAGILDVTETPITANAAAAPDGEFVPLHAMVEEAERRHIRSALERAGGSVMKTSELLGISRKTLWEKMKKLRIGNATVHEAGA